MTAISDAITELPKVELHVHLEGSLRPATMFTLAERNGRNLGVSEPEDLLALYTFRNFDDFARLFRTGLDVLRSPQDFTTAVLALAAELADQNVRYAEVTTTPYQHCSRGVSPEDYAAGLNEGRRRAASEYGLVISWICDISRESEDPTSTAALELLLGPHCPDDVIGLGLGGFEVGYPAGLFAEPFARARAAGFASLPHAGETVGPASVRDSISTLKADRIGHGVRSIEDPSLVQQLVRDEIPLEICPTSNVRLGGYPSIAEHPLPDLLAAGVRVTVNSDDPAYFSTTISDELQSIHDHLGVSIECLADMQKLALDVGYASDGLRAKFLRELAAWRHRWGR